MQTSVTINNGEMTARIDAHGAQLRSLTKNGREYLWQGGSDWEDTAPVLFPMCSNLKDGVYKIKGKEYSMPSHGFAQNMDFACKKLSENCAELSLSSSAETLAQYPFEFRFTVRFTLEDGALKTEYITENPADTDMYYSCGGHEGYAVSAVSNCEIEFSDTEDFNVCVLDGNILSRKTENVHPASRLLPLKDEFFAIDALIFDHPASSSLILRDRADGREIKVDFSDFENLLIWTVPGGRFVCIEPWCGFPDYVDTDGDFTKKAAIRRLAPRASETLTHRITL